MDLGKVVLLCLFRGHHLPYLVAVPTRPDLAADEERYSQLLLNLLPQIPDELHSGCVDLGHVICTAAAAHSFHMVCARSPGGGVKHHGNLLRANFTDEVDVLLYTRPYRSFRAAIQAVGHVRGSASASHARQVCPGKEEAGWAASGKKKINRPYRHPLPADWWIDTYRQHVFQDWAPRFAKDGLEGTEIWELKCLEEDELRLEASFSHDGVLARQHRRQECREARPGDWAHDS
mmetsp:Transcript_7743/g.22044  ORF Transcript_7743/g.22044 Transcript_7743/m.22044 type:complete len:233 (+) Transcript_7743:743-1441(+)